MAKYIVQHRRGTAAQWADKDTIIPKEGEIVIEIDEENSLHKLKIGDGVHTYAELAYLMAGDDIVTQVLAQALPRVATVTLDVNKWKKVTHKSDPKLGYYRQLITVDGITEYSKLDLRPSADMLAEFTDLNIAFVTENRRGVMYAYSVGDVPLKTYEMQATITETDMSADHDTIIGMTVGTPAVTLPLVGVKGVDNAFVQTTEETENNNLAVSQSSIALGVGTVAKEKAQIAAGFYNADDEDAIVVFGNGTDDNNRSNAGAITKRGFKLSEAQFGTEDMQEGDFLPCGVFYFVYDKNIKFTLDAVSYKVTDDVTWGEWVETTGSTVGFGVTSKGVVTFANEDANSTKCVEDSDGNVVWATDYIHINAIYTSGHINLEAYGQKTFYAGSDAYIGNVADYSFSKIGNYGFDTKYIKKITNTDVYKEIASRAVAGAAMYSTNSSYYYNVTKSDNGTLDKVTKLNYYLSHTKEKLYLGIEDDASTTWIGSDGSQNYISRNNYQIRIGLDKDDYSKCIVALLGVNKGANTTGTDVFTVKAYDAVRSDNYGEDTKNVITDMAIMKRTFDAEGNLVGGTASNVSSPSPYVAFIKYELDKEALITFWNTAFGTSLTELPSELYIAVSCTAYDKDGVTVVSCPLYGSVLSKPQMDAINPTTITNGVTKQCPILPHIIKIDNSVVDFDDKEPTTHLE